MNKKNKSTKTKTLIEQNMSNTDSDNYDTNGSTNNNKNGNGNNNNNKIINMQLLSFVIDSNDTTTFIGKCVSTNNNYLILDINKNIPFFSRYIIYRLDYVKIQTIPFIDKKNDVKNQTIKVANNLDPNYSSNVNIYTFLNYTKIGINKLIKVELINSLTYDILIEISNEYLFFSKDEDGMYKEEFLEYKNIDKWICDNIANIPQNVKYQKSIPTHGDVKILKTFFSKCSSFEKINTLKKWFSSIRFNYVNNGKEMIKYKSDINNKYSIHMLFKMIEKNPLWFVNFDTNTLFNHKMIFHFNNNLCSDEPINPGCTIISSICNFNTFCDILNYFNNDQQKRREDDNLQNDSRSPEEPSVRSTRGSFLLDNRKWTRILIYKCAYVIGKFLIQIIKLNNYELVHFRLCNIFLNRNVNDQFKKFISLEKKMFDKNELEMISNIEKHESIKLIYIIHELLTNKYVFVDHDGYLKYIKHDNMRRYLNFNPFEYDTESTFNCYQIKEQVIFKNEINTLISKTVKHFYKVQKSVDNITDNNNNTKFDNEKPIVHIKCDSNTIESYSSILKNMSKKYNKEHISILAVDLSFSRKLLNLYGTSITQNISTVNFIYYTTHILKNKKIIENNAKINIVILFQFSMFSNETLYSALSLYPNQKQIIMIENLNYPNSYNYGFIGCPSLVTKNIDPNNIYFYNMNNNPDIIRKIEKVDLIFKYTLDYKALRPLLLPAKLTCSDNNTIFAITLNKHESINLNNVLMEIILKSYKNEFNNEINSDSKHFLMVNKFARFNSLYKDSNNNNNNNNTFNIGDIILIKKISIMINPKLKRAKTNIIKNIILIDFESIYNINKSNNRSSEITYLYNKKNNNTSQDKHLMIDVFDIESNPDALLSIQFINYHVNNTVNLDIPLKYLLKPNNNNSKTDDILLNIICASHLYHVKDYTFDTVLLFIDRPVEKLQCISENLFKCFNLIALSKLIIFLNTDSSLTQTRSVNSIMALSPTQRFYYDLFMDNIKHNGKNFKSILFDIPLNSSENV